MPTLEEQISQLEKTLSASDHDDEYKKEGRLAVVKTAAQEMDDKEKKEARKAFETKEEKKEARKASEEEEKKEAKKSTEEEKKEAKKSKKSTDEEEKKEARKASEEEEKDKKIATLTASVNYLTTKPIIDKMLTARRVAGMSPKDLEKFGHSLYGKSIDEIKQRFTEDQIFHKKSPLVATEQLEYPFNRIEGTLVASDDSNKSLEELFN